MKTPSAITLILRTLTSLVCAQMEKPPEFLKQRPWKDTLQEIQNLKNDLDRHMQSRFPVDPLPQPKPVIRAGKPPENLPRTEPTPIPQPKPKTYIPVRNDCAWFAVSENGQQWKLAQGRFLDKDALCVLKVGNGTEHAAIGKVIDMFTDRKVCEFVVLSKTSITLEHVPEGKYSLIYVLGDEIVKGTNRFWEPLEYTRIEAPFEFKTRQLIQEVEYSVLSITLHGVRGGKAKAEAIEGKEFGKY